ncbi:Ubiquitin-protein ligase, putative [Candida maltosa Xu316]|uniref:Ubiquitin-protein ligase, putative n=1 Tax=Candida maltosa (strain Xu316) TaxID=1245528 RepID=M3JZ57_CANMX|nr:Ubiquitin-protein ligase, putative [Candida maltosa Xu316]
MSTAKPEYKSASNNTDNESSDGLSQLDKKAIALFEDAVKKEAQGLMSDAVDLYRKAFRINDQVDQIYRSIHLPTALNKLQSERGKNYITRVDEHKVSKINVDELIASFKDTEAHAPDPLNNEDPNALVVKFTNLKLKQDTVISYPVSHLVLLPEDIWIYIFELLIHSSPESWFSMAISCKRFAYLGFGKSTIWRELCKQVYPRQVYEENQYYLQNPSLGTDINDDDELPIPINQLRILPQYKNSWKFMLQNRPFVKFLGCYISVVNYYSEGGKAEFSNAWSNPVKTITYYRYLRFYPDGLVLKVLTVLPPDGVIPYLSRLHENLPASISELGKPIYSHDENRNSHKIYHGKWTISSDGEVHIIIENGSVEYLTFHYWFKVKTLGHINKHAKLSWIKYNSVRKPISGEQNGEDQEEDDRIGEIMEFSIRNEKPFKFSRVKSYTLTN